MRAFGGYWLLFLIPVLSEGQVYLSGLGSNPVIEAYLLKNPEHASVKSSIITYPRLYLPFKDDFSDNKVFPDSARWIDRDVYINAEYPVYPVDYSVATFDVLDSLGEFYSNASTFPFEADHLTSFPLRLDSVFDENHTALWKLTAADSVYLSFYYQPQGRGDVPLSNDSLILQFGFYTGDTHFKYIDSVLVYGYEYLSDPDEYILPFSFVHPPLSCDTSLKLILTDTLFYSDSIMLPCDSVFISETEWKNVWSATGQSLDTFLLQNDQFFRSVMIPITDTNWFRSDFQFRFMNYGSLSEINSWKSNTDHWHIDRVYLNTGRSANDIFTRDIRFVQPASSLLGGYTSIPTWHYNTDMMVDTIIVYAHNTDSVSHTCIYDYTVQDQDGNYLPGFNYPGFSGTMLPLTQMNVNTYQPFTGIPVNSWFDYSGEEELVFTVNHLLQDADSAGIGDTIPFIQKFDNYFAYDDGTAERSYGASADNTRIAVQFRTQTVDTLRGMDIYFNRTQGDYNERNFHSVVWNDNNGKPGTEIFRLENQLPYFPEPNEFSRYVFQDTIIRMGHNVFYIGVIQTTNDNLNIGFDRNTNSRAKTFYTTDGDWLMSPFDGSLMIRPLFGRTLSDSTFATKSFPDHLQVNPNPAVNRDYITLVLPGVFVNPDYQQYLTLRIFDYSGRKIYSSPFTKNLNISWLKSGFYMIDIFDEGFTRHYTSKLIVERR
jgi:hypothetical protein